MSFELNRCLVAWHCTQRPKLARDFNFEVTLLLQKLKDIFIGQYLEKKWNYDKQADIWALWESTGLDISNIIKKRITQLHVHYVSGVSGW